MKQIDVFHFIFVNLKLGRFVGLNICWAVLLKIFSGSLELRIICDFRLFKKGQVLLTLWNKVFPSHYDQVKRMANAVAVITQPAVLLADNPTGDLYRTSRAEIIVDRE